MSLKYRTGSHMKWCWPQSCPPETCNLLNEAWERDWLPPLVENGEPQSHIFYLPILLIWCTHITCCCCQSFVLTRAANPHSLGLKFLKPFPLVGGGEEEEMRGFAGDYLLISTTSGRSKNLNILRSGRLSTSQHKSKQLHIILFNK